MRARSDYEAMLLDTGDLLMEGPEAEVEEPVHGGGEAGGPSGGAGGSGAHGVDDPADPEAAECSEVPLLRVEEAGGQQLLKDLVPGPRPSPYRILPEEKEAAVAFALEHPREGYRRLAWMMVDEDVAYLSPSSVYRIPSLGADLLHRWKRSQRSGEPPPEPTAPNERWHTDLMYLRIGDSWYFLVTVLDAYSRYVVHWELLTTKTAAAVRVVIPGRAEEDGSEGRDRHGQRDPVHGEGLRAAGAGLELEHIRIRTYHPESNGKLERFHRSTRDALDETDLVNLSRAREIIGGWVEFYNTERLHAGLEYLPPAEYGEGEPEARLEERREKLERARERRERVNRERLQQAAA